MNLRRWRRGSSGAARCEEGGLQPARGVSPAPPSLCSQSSPFWQKRGLSDVTVPSEASRTVTVNWCFATPITGTLSVTDASGTTQYVTITGEP